MSENETQLRALGRTVQGPMDRPAPELLERFRSPGIDPEQNESGALLALRIDAPEFTSLCPITGQPDWARIVIRYQPDQWCVESKSLKLYLNSYRNFGEFHESCVNRICNDLVRLLDPHWVVVEGRFTPRGGIPFWPVSLYRRSLRDGATQAADQGAAPAEQYDLLAPLTERLDQAARREDVI